MEKKTAGTYDLKNRQITLRGAAAGTDLGLGAVPNGRNRFIVSVMMETMTVSALVTLGQTAAATGAILAGNERLKKKLNDTFIYPEKPNIETPIFSIDGEKFLGAVTDGATDVELTVLYFDA